MTVVILIITILLIAFTGWISSILISLGFGPLMARVLYLVIGLYSISLISPETLFQTLFYFLTFIVASFFFYSASKIIKSGRAITRVVSDTKWAMVFFIIGTTIGYTSFLYKSYI